jgi:hypothetical protein
MRCHDDIGQREDRVVIRGPVRPLRRLFFRIVQTCGGQMSLGQRAVQRLVVDGRTASGIHQDCAGFHHGEIRHLTENGAFLGVIGACMRT